MATSVAATRSDGKLFLKLNKSFVILKLLMLAYAFENNLQKVQK